MIIDVSTLMDKHRPYLYVLWRIVRTKPKLWDQLLIQLWFYLLYKLNLFSEPVYQAKRWSILAQIDLAKLPKIFNKPVYSKKLVLSNNAEVVDQFPNLLLKLLAPDYQVRGLNWNQDEQKLEYQKFTARLDPAKKLVLSPVVMKRYQVDQPCLIFFNGHFYTSYRKYFLAQILLAVRDIVLLGILSLVFGGLIIYMTGAQYNLRMVAQVITSKKLLLLNTWPIFCLSLLGYSIFNSISLGVAVSGFCFTVLGLIDFFMLRYRSYPFKYSDIFLSGEAVNMGHRYSYMPPKQYLLIMLMLAASLILVHFMFKPAKQSLIKSITLLLMPLVAFAISYQRFYVNNRYYNAIANVKYGSQWNGADQYMTKGFVYSFIHSTGDAKLKVPVGYSDARARQLLARYHNQKIPLRKKVNLILIQLEAFQDFSKYSKLNIDPRVYAGLNEIRKQSLHGELTTTIFAGGTIDTERKTITGYSEMQPLNANTSSLVRYFNQNGYYTLKMHPGHQWFFNRQNTAKYLGFDKFIAKENYYNAKVSAASIVKDRLVFADLDKQFDRYTANNKQPLFAQLVTYQNHGPYPSTYVGTNWLPNKAGYNQADYAIINNYLNGVKQTSDQLLNLINKFKSKKQPVVIAFWGDHNPWGGNNNSTYKMLGINLDQSTLAGFNNYFNTPYCIWANDEAKKTLKTDFKGQGPQMSPMYMLPTIFEHLGLKGDQYLQLLTSLKQQVPVFGLNGRYLYQGHLVAKLPAKIKHQVDDFKIVQYYRQTHLDNN